ncbi:MAG: alpha/beta hydrolase-fold protein [Acidobacteriaceae bacterium]
MSVLSISFAVLCLLPSLALARPGQAPPVSPIEPRPAGSVPSPTCATHHSFLSAALKREMSYCLILPADYEASQRSYPVLYLLHGLFGSENDWLANTRVADYARPLPLIIIMPEADDSWYTNSLADPRNRYEDYVFNDLIAAVDTRYRTLKSRDSRFIAGLSMGGYGAIKAGLRDPRKFAVVGGFSSALDVTRYPSRWTTARLAFGPHFDSQKDPQNDDYVLLAQADTAQLPYFFVSCGADDPLLHSSRELVSMMGDLHVGYEYHEFPGAHTWRFWDRSIAALLRELALRM